MDRNLATASAQDATQLGATEKRDLLERLAARLAHEIRNPLSSLDIHVQLLEEDLETLAPGARSKVAPRLEIIHGELHRLESIVEQFLRLAGPSALELERLDLPHLVNHVCELLRPEAAARDIEIVADIRRAPPFILADPTRLTQALVNLVINALQAVGSEGRVEVSAVADGDTLAIEVRDDGPGLPDEKQAAIFDPYYTTKPEGTGLGLWIVQQIVVAHGGTLTARNDPDGGAVFTVRLPLRKA